MIFLLLLIHAPIGQDADICCVARLLRIRGKAYAASHVQCVIIDLEGLLQHLLQPVLDLSYPMLIEIHAEEDREFIAADANTWLFYECTARGASPFSARAYPPSYARRYH